MVAETFYCDTCNLTLTGKEPYQQHIGGKKHQKKVNASGQKAEAKAEAGDPENADQSETNKDSASTEDLAGEIVATGETDEKTGSEDTKEKEEADGDEEEEGGDDPVKKAVKANIQGKLAKKRPPYQGNCVLCNVHYTSSTHEAQHLSGAKHGKKVKIQEGTSGITASYFCQFCNVRVNSMQQMEQHKEGVTHKKKVDLAQQAQIGGPSPAKKKFMPGNGADITPTPSPSATPPL